MYNNHFGFRESPFSLTPNPDLFYANRVYHEAYANLRYATESKKGFVALTGEVGTGKTTLLRKLMRDLRHTTRFAFVFNTSLAFEELLQVILSDLGLPAQAKDKLAMLRELNEYLIEQLEKGYVVCLLIDEAQNLSDDSLEGLRLLSNFETNREKLLQIVLIGQPELKARLDRPALRQLKQRIAIHCEITPLKTEEVGPYITFRLRAAGYQGKHLFDAAAIHEIAVYSKGIPRLINVICDNALLMAFAASRKTVSVHLIREAARDLRLIAAQPNLPTAASGPSPREVRKHVFASESANWARERKVTRRGTVAAAIMIGVLVALVLAYRSDPKNFHMISDRAFELFTPEMIQERWLVPRQQTVRQKQRAEIGDPEAKKIEAELTMKGGTRQAPYDATKQEITERILVRYGSTIYDIAIATYRANAVLGLDLIKEFNPRITNLNWVVAGQELFVPQLTGASLSRRQQDGSYRLIVNAFLSRRDADDLVRRVDRAGYRAGITATRVANDLLVHRVEIVGLNSLDHATQTLRIAVQEGWLSY
jgi:type II secretory pathway predicted ATPase ExeA